MKGRYTRRYDRNGNPYYVDRETGRRVSGEKWQRERERIKRRQEKQERQQQTKPQPPVQPQRPTIDLTPSEPAVPPFPPHVSDIGEPIDDDGFLDDDAFAIEGEDDT